MNKTDIRSAISLMDNDELNEFRNIVGKEVERILSDRNLLSKHGTWQVEKLMLILDNKTKYFGDPIIIVNAAKTKVFGKENINKLIRCTKSMSEDFYIQHAQELEEYHNVIFSVFPNVKTDASKLMNELNKKDPIDILEKNFGRSDQYSLLMEISPETFEKYYHCFSIAKILTTKSVLKFLIKPENKAYRDIIRTKESLNGRYYSNYYTNYYNLIFHYVKDEALCKEFLKDETPYEIINAAIPIRSKWRNNHRYETIDYRKEYYELYKKYIIPLLDPKNEEEETIIYNINNMNEAYSECNARVVPTIRSTYSTNTAISFLKDKNLCL